MLQCDISQAFGSAEGGWPVRRPAGRSRGAVTVPSPEEFPLPYEIQALRGRNRLHLRVWGHPRLDQAFDFASDAIAEGSKLRPGFDLISDVSGLSSLPDPCMPEVERLSGFLVANGMRRVVRVCGPLPEVILKLERQARAKGYAAHLATSLAEAEALLDETR